MSANQSSGPGTFDPDKFRKGDFNLGQRLLRVAIIADTHVSEADGVSNSPFAVNKLANERLRYAIACVNHLGPDLCIHLGDMTHPVPGRPALFAQAVDCFRRQIAQIKCETLLLPGNHDVGDKPLAWSPAEPAREAYIELWKQAFGPDYRAITRGGCHFLTLNAQLLNTGFAAEQRQREWFCEYLEARKGGRFFVNLHYPPFLHEPGEPEHYDNIGGHGRAWLLDTLKRHRVEALFAGHAHHFWCHRYQDTDCYILPSTAFVRQDYSEMFRAAPMEGSEYGRDDRQKLGFVLLEIYEGGHLCRPVRTDGGRLPEGTRADAYTPPRSLRLPPPLHPRQSPALNLGFDMRKDWLESTQIPPSGSLDEFDRKQARNDYPLMALWEMGVRYARIPFADLDSRRRLARLRALRLHGMRFWLFTYGAPERWLLEHLMRHSDILDAWEITAPLKSLRVLKKPDVLLSLPPIYLSKPPGRDEKPARRGSKKHGAVYYHVIKHGFSPREGNLPTHDALAGYVFRVGSGDSVLESAAAAQRIAERMDTQASLHVRLGGDNPARPQDDEAWTCQRALEATVCAYVFPRLHVFIDTLTDVERGYFPRLGVLDALCNPRRGFHAIRNLNALLQQSDTGRPRPAWRLCHKTYAAHRLILLQRRDSAERVVITPPGVAVSPALSQAAVTPTQVYDLIEGERYSADGPAPAHNPLLIRATAAAP